jgi:ABC-2 type transport system permease protein
MKRLWVIASKDIREVLRSRSTYLYIALLFFLSFTYFSRFTTVINTAFDNNASQEIINEISQLFLDSIASTLPMMYSILMCTIFAAYSVVVDKVKRNLESLMVSPISIKQIWMAKTLGVALPSMLIALGVTLIAYLVMSFILVIPYTHVFIIPSLMVILIDLVLVPILIFFVVSLVIYLQLIISNPRVANLIFTGLFLLLYFGSNIITGAGYEINYALIYLGLIILCGGLTYIFSLLLTKEKVILSNKS